METNYVFRLLHLNLSLTEEPSCNKITLNAETITLAKQYETIAVRMF